VIIVLNVKSVAINLKNYLIDVNHYSQLHAKKDLEAHRDFKVNLVVEVLLEWMGLMELKDFRVFRDLLVIKVPGDFKASREIKDHKVPWVFKVLRVPRVPKVLEVVELNVVILYLVY
jgi:hypothetical protein